jgi:Gpi18-like mannosyltransferase
MSETEGKTRSALEPREAAPEQPPGSRQRLGVLAPLMGIIALALGLRLFIAYVEVPGSGLLTDLDLFRSWGDSVARYGPLGVYDRTGSDYPPICLYIFGILGAITHPFGGIGAAVKLPAILADGVLIAIVYRMSLELGASLLRARLAALTIAVTPLIWFDSAVWGQVESIGAVMLLLALRELLHDRRERAAALAVAVFLTKWQFGIVALVVGVVVARRSLLPDSGLRQTGRFLRSVVAAGVTGVALCLPAVGLDMGKMYAQFTYAAAEYPQLTVNAYNPWVFVSSGGQSMATGTPLPDISGVAVIPGVMIGPFPALYVGTALVIVATLAVCAWVARHDDPLSLTLALGVLLMAFFILPTRVHERYLYAFFAPAALLLSLSLRWQRMFLLLSLASFVNVAAVYGGLDQGPAGFWLALTVTPIIVAGFVWAVVQLAPGRRATLRAEAGVAGSVPG